MKQHIILDSIFQERERQNQLHTWNKKTNRLAVLMEEVGEVAQAMQGEGDLKEELTQVASLCVRWLEEL